MNECLDVLLKRGSLRQYQNKQVSQEDLKLVLDCALRAPTAGNMMLYSIIVIQNEETKKKLAISCDNQKFIASAPTLLVFVADLHKWYKYYQQNDTEVFCHEQGRSLEGPNESNFILAMQDALIAAQNAVIAAQSLGLGTCYIGDIMENIEYHQELLHLPRYVYPVTMLTLGYYPESYSLPLKDRFDSKYVIFNESYPTLSTNDISDMFSKRDALYVKQNKFGAKNYAQMHYSFKMKSDFSKEMTRSLKLGLETFKSESIFSRK